MDGSEERPTINNWFRVMQIHFACLIFQSTTFRLPFECCNKECSLLLFNVFPVTKVILFLQHFPFFIFSIFRLLFLQLSWLLNKSVDLTCNKCGRVPNKHFFRQIKKFSINFIMPIHTVPYIQHHTRSNTYNTCL